MSAPQSVLPKLLITAPTAFNHVTGNGITFGNLFRGWPQDRLCTVHNDDVPVSYDICSTYYKLSEPELDRPAIFRGLGRATKQATFPAPSGPSASSGGLLRRAKRMVFGDGLPERGRLSPSLELWIAKFQPEVLYTTLGSNAIMELIVQIHYRFALPLVVHFMDDWQSAIYRGGLLSAIERRRMQRLIATLVEAASVRLGIGEGMSREYASRFGRPFLAFQNTVDVARSSALAKRDSRIGNPIRLLYAGSVLGFAQADSLVTCCEVVAALRREGMAIALDIYSPSNQTGPIRDRLMCSDAIRLHDVITDDTLFFQAIAVADILLLPVNFDTHSTRYVRLSMPTKVPSYLVSGTPVLVYGPKGVAQVEYAREAGWGYVVDDPNPTLLGNAIKLLAQDFGLRERLSTAARRVAAERHDAAVVRPGFQLALANASRSTRGGLL